MTEQKIREDQLITAFEMMWGKYHEPVRLIRRDFTIIAVNKACEAVGGVPGVKCNATSPELHKGCQAMEALKTNELKIVNSDRDGIHWTTFWIPVSGIPNYYLHFTNGLNEYMEKLKATSK
ncbi:hypothetical protein [Desulfosporosinus sp. OT]|uniref:hypothetical protein n=1 Tax=Desulfosporosinus sp. OT TaxID=913865 RepID=UPI000223AB20|nr:hypothetical protein [Desulfosporosinus sp. OT]EGW36952.1 hypothetical protein DOT_5142 [Desulfosporosinus sp. OT]